MANNQMTKARAKRYLKSIRSWKKKRMSITDLSLDVGIFEDVVRDNLAAFDPMIRMLPDVNVLEYEILLDKFISEIKVIKPKQKPKKVGNYKGIGDFVYKNMTIPGGIVDASIELSFEQIQVLKKLVNEEYKAKKPLK